MLGLHWEKFQRGKSRFDHCCFFMSQEFLVYIHTYIHTYIHYITLHYITLHYITLHDITSHHITSHHITSHYITIHTYIQWFCSAGPQIIWLVLNEAWPPITDLKPGLLTTSGSFTNHPTSDIQQSQDNLESLKHLSDQNLQTVLYFIAHSTLHILYSRKL